MSNPRHYCHASEGYHLDLGRRASCSLLPRIIGLVSDERHNEWYLKETRCTTETFVFVVIYQQH